MSDDTDDMPTRHGKTPRYYLNNPLLRNAGASIAYTSEQIDEWLKCREDPLYFFENYIHIVHVDFGLIKFVPRFYQKEMVENIRDNRFTIFKWPRQHGKALCLETPILTSTGFEKLKDLEVGDTIYGADGKETKITFITETMIGRKTYEVVFDNGDIVKACEDHLWTINSNNWKTRNGSGSRKIGERRTMTTKEIIPLLKSSQSPYIDFNKPLEMIEKSLSVDPYTLGLWLGDGDASMGWITAHTDDIEFYSKILDVEKVYTDKRNNNVCRFKVAGLTHSLRELELLKNKHIPTEYLLGSSEQRLELLKGLMDTDGSVARKSGNCEFYQKNEMFIDQFRTLLSSLGIKSRKSPKVVDGRIYWTVRFKPPFHVFKLERKSILQNLSNNHPKNSRLYIKEIREVDSVPMRCLQVDNDDHLFLAGTTLVPTHNTQTVAAVLLWYALFNKRYNIALLAHKADQAREIMARIKTSFENLPTWLQQGVKKWNDGHVGFENGSRIKAYATGSGAVRGQTLNIVYLDEFAFVERNVQEKFYTGTYPVITSGNTTKIIMTSTPNGMDLFYKFWNESELGKNTYVRHQSYWWDIEGRDEQWKKETIQNTSERQFSQEFETEFLGSTNTLIAAEKLRTLTYKEPIGKIEDLTIFENPRKGRNYVCCVDSSEGLGQDYHAFAIIDVTTIPYNVVAVYHNNKVHHLLLPTVIYNAAKHYNEAMVLVEIMSTGGQVATILLQELEYENVITTTLKGRNGQRIGGGFGGELRLGVMMNKQVKRIGTTNLKALIEQDKLIFNDERILKELFVFVCNDKQQYEAEEGHNDDLVMSLTLFGWMVAQNYFKESTDTDVRERMVQENMSWLEQDMTPFAMVDDHQYDEENSELVFTPTIMHY